jgi:hypothetical protein
MNGVGTKKLSAAQMQELVAVLKERFEANKDRHPGIAWAEVEARLVGHPKKLQALAHMEATSGEPDVVGRDAKTGVVHFVDCSAESPKGRMSLCYDDEALNSRKEHKPADSAMGLAAAMGIELLTEEQYQHLQLLGVYDAKSSSWLQTPAAIRKLGGAIFGDRRFGRVFIYHNGAQSYYSGRGFRGSLQV